MATAASLIKEAKLDAALAELQAEVKARPTDAAKRFELGELLLTFGEWARADNQFDLVSTQDPSFGVVIALIRQLIRAEMSRKEVFDQGRAPDVIGDADQGIAAALRLLVDLRDPAVQTVDALHSVDGALTGTVDGRAYEGVRDLDDAVAGVLEVLTSTGKYYWVPWRRVKHLEMHPPARLRDVIWRPADLDVADGPSGVVYIPAIYAGGGEAATPGTRLGRETQWVELKGLTRGVGLRTLLLGDEDLSLNDFTTLTVDEAAQA